MRLIRPAICLNTTKRPTARHICRHRKKQDLLKALKPGNSYLQSQKAVRSIIENGNFELVADKAVVAPRSFQKRDLLQEAVTRILRKYASSFHRRKREKREEEHLVYKTMRCRGKRFLCCAI